MKCSFFSVIDGHSGDWCAKYLCNEMVHDMLQILHKEITDYDGNLSHMKVADLIKKTFDKLYKKMDQEFYERNNGISLTCGAVVVSCFIIGNMLYCINVGDARAVLCRNGKALNLSFDHKATSKKEQKLVK